MEGTATPQRLISKVTERPPYREILLDALLFCTQERTLEEALARIEAHPDFPASLSTSQRLIDILTRHGGLIERYEIDGCSLSRDQYAALLEASDQEMPEATAFLATSEAGRQAAEALSPALRFERLLESEAERAHLFKEVLRFCNQPRSLADIDAFMRSIGQETRVGKSQSIVYPTFVIDSLQRAGCITWQNGWVATDAGREVMPMV